MSTRVIGSSKITREAPYAKEVTDKEASHLPAQPAKLVQAVETFLRQHWSTQSAALGLTCGLDVNGDPIEVCHNQHDQDKWASKPEEYRFSHVEFLCYTWHHPSQLPDPSRGDFAGVSTGQTKVWCDVVAIFNNLSSEIKPYFSVTSTWNKVCTLGNGTSYGCLWVEHHYEKGWPNYSHTSKQVTSQFTVIPTLEFSRPFEDVDLRDAVEDQLVADDKYDAWRDGKHALSSDDYRGCTIESVGVEGHDVAFVRIGTKDEAPWKDVPVFLRLGNAVAGYIAHHLKADAIRQCSPTYPVWTDGEKVAKVIFDDEKPNEYANTIAIAAELKATPIPHPKILAHNRVSPTAAVIIMEYVGPDLDRFDHVRYIKQEGDDQLQAKMDDLIKLIIKHGYHPDAASCNFCVNRDGVVYAIDWPDWKRSAPSNVVYMTGLSN